MSALHLLHPHKPGTHAHKHAHKPHTASDISRTGSLATDRPGHRPPKGFPKASKGLPKDSKGLQKASEGLRKAS